MNVENAMAGEAHRAKPDVDSLPAAPCFTIQSLRIGIRPSREVITVTFYCDYDVPLAVWCLRDEGIQLYTTNSSPLIWNVYSHDINSRAYEVQRHISNTFRRHSPLLLMYINTQSPFVRQVNGTIEPRSCQATRTSERVTWFVLEITYQSTRCSPKNPSKNLLLL